nr:putative mediator of RNA polymerase II transcription subunit 26 isoform X3 [Helicoverpa armigera]
MKLPILILVLVAIGAAVAPQPTAKTPIARSPTAKSPAAKSSVGKKISNKNSNHTSKRELYEGNFGDKTVLGVKYVLSSTPRTDYSDDLKKIITEQTSDAQQIFGVRVPQIAKISDVLSGQGASFEAAVAKHLYSPISVYQARFAAPTSFIPTPAVYQKPKPFELSNSISNQKTPENAPKQEHQPTFRLDGYVQSGLPSIQGHLGLPQEIFQTQPLGVKQEPEYFPVLTSQQFGPIKFQSLLPSQFLEQNKIYQLLPFNSGFASGFANNQNGINEKSYSNVDSEEQAKLAPTPRSIENNPVPVPTQGYHAHPNGAISFSSFSQNLPVNPQYESVPQSPPGNFNNQPFPVALPQSQQSIAYQLQPQQQKIIPLKQISQYPPLLRKIVQELNKYQPHFHPDLINFKPQGDPRAVDSFRQNVLVEHPRQQPHPHSESLGLQRLPAFKPLPQSELSPEAYFQHTSPSPIAAEPKPFNKNEQSNQTPSHAVQPLAPVSPPREHTPLPPLKPNYNKHVKPLKQRRPTTSEFLPTTVQPLPSSSPYEQPEPDQLIASTTIQPYDKYNDNDNVEWKESDRDSDTYNREPDNDNNPQPDPIISSTYQPEVMKEPRPEFSQPSGPEPEEHSLSVPQPIKSEPTHDVVIQQQEVQEIILEPSPQPEDRQQNQIRNQPEQEADQLQSQEHHQLLEQMQPLHYQQEIQDLQSQYHVEARQLHEVPKQYAIQQIGSQQYQIQPYAYPLQFYQLQAKPLQGPQAEPEQPQPRQQQVEQTQSPQYQQHSIEPKSDAQPSPPTTEDSEAQYDQNEQDSDDRSQDQSKRQQAAGKPIEQYLAKSGPNYRHSYGPVLSSHFPHIFAQPQRLAEADYGSQLLNLPNYPEVQYFGKFARELFGNGQH